MTKPLPRTQSIILGAVVIAGILLGVLGLFQIGQKQRLWSESMTLEVGFAQLQGVGVGTPVRVRGLEAGVVTAIELPQSAAPDSPLTLRLRIDRSFQPMIFADARATILSEGMVGTKVVEIMPGKPSSGSITDGGRLAAEVTPDLNDLLKQTREVLVEVREGQGTLGKFLKDDRAYSSIVAAADQAKKMMESGQLTADSLRQDADAIKKLPIIRSYVEDSAGILVRPGFDRKRQAIPLEDLFEPGKATLTAEGRERLNLVGEWANTFNQKGSDIVVVALCDPNYEKTPSVAKALNQRQSESVAEYLRDTHRVHKLSILRWRDVKTLGLGHEPHPASERDLPAARVEVIVFIPQM